MKCTMKAAKFGFSKGWASLAPKKPPPFDPNSFIGIIDATGPLATLTVSPCSVITFADPLKVMGIPKTIKIIATTTDKGSRIRVHDFKKSLKKLPTPGLESGLKPLTIATPAARLVAALTNCKKVNTAVCDR